MSSFFPIPMEISRILNYLVLLMETIYITIPTKKFQRPVSDWWEKNTAEQEGCSQVSNIWSEYFYFLCKNNKTTECSKKHSRIKRFT